MIAFEDFPIHVRLMLLTLRWRLSEHERSQCQQLVAIGVDWNHLTALAIHHRVGPLVFSVLNGLNETDGLAVPDDILWQLQQDAIFNAFRAALSAKETNRIVRRFSEERFELSILKGVALSEQVYGNASVRHVGDIDLLTSSTSLPRKIELLAELGYPLTIPEARLTPRRAAAFVKYWKDFTFASPDQEFIVELHWRLFNNSLHPGNRLLDGATFTKATVFGVPMRVLAPADQFLYQAVHGVSDAWIYLKTLADVAGYLHSLSPSELDSALSRAASVGVLPYLSAAIHLSNDWLGAGFHSPRLMPADDPLATAVRARTERMLLQRNFMPDRSDPSPGDWLRLELKLVPGLRSKLEVAGRIVNRPRLWTRVDLPDELFWLYPILGALLPPRHHVPKSDLNSISG